MSGHPPEVRGVDIANDADMAEVGGSRAIKASGLLAVLNGVIIISMVSELRNKRFVVQGLS